MQKNAAKLPIDNFAVARRTAEGDSRVTSVAIGRINAAAESKFRIERNLPTDATYRPLQVFSRGKRAPSVSSGIGTSSPPDELMVVQARP